MNSQLDSAYNKLCTALSEMNLHPTGSEEWRLSVDKYLCTLPEMCKAVNSFYETLGEQQ